MAAMPWTWAAMIGHHRGVDRAARGLLEAVVATARACGEAYRVRVVDPRVEIEARAEDGFVVQLEVGPRVVCVRLATWERRFSREDDPEDDHFGCPGDARDSRSGSIEVVPRARSTSAR